MAPSTNVLALLTPSAPASGTGFDWFSTVWIPLVMTIVVGGYASIVTARFTQFDSLRERILTAVVRFRRRCELTTEAGIQELYEAMLELELEFDASIWACAARHTKAAGAFLAIKRYMVNGFKDALETAKTAAANTVPAEHGKTIRAEFNMLASPIVDKWIGEIFLIETSLLACSLPSWLLIRLKWRKRLHPLLLRAQNISIRVSTIGLRLKIARVTVLLVAARRFPAFAKALNDLDHAKKRWAALKRYLDGETETW